MMRALVILLPVAMIAAGMGVIELGGNLALGIVTIMTGTVQTWLAVVLTDWLIIRPGR